MAQYQTLPGWLVATASSTLHLLLLTSALALERAPAYWEVLAERGDADFRPVSRFLAAVFFEDEARAQAMALRLMLHVRQTYQSIFDRLI